MAKIIHTQNKNFSVLQITDTHLFESDSTTLFGVKTNSNFFEAVNSIKKKINPLPNLILLTGDLSQDLSKTSYQTLMDTLSVFNIPIYWIPGNHDKYSVMKKVFSPSPLFHNESLLYLNHWSIIFLNTTKKDSDEGYLSSSRLKELNKLLIESSKVNNPIIIVMHHHPIETGTPLIDKYILQNRMHFWSIVSNYPLVKLIICGHVHGDYKISYNNIMVEAAPATCLQWLRGTTKLKIEKKIGYKIFYFSEKKYSSTVYLQDFV